MLWDLSSDLQKTCGVRLKPILCPLLGINPLQSPISSRFSSFFSSLLVLLALESYGRKSGGAKIDAEKLYGGPNFTYDQLTPSYYRLLNKIT